MDKKEYDKIKSMEYSPDRNRYVGKDGSELRVKPFSDGSGYKYDYYDKSTYGNNSHSSTHVKSDLNQNWKRTDNDRSSGTNSQTNSSGSGCYLTTACLSKLKENFDDNCYELTILRWFRDNFVSEEDIVTYYEISPIIVDKINQFPNSNQIYIWIYENVISTCVEAIKREDYEFAYKRYKNSVIALSHAFVSEKLNTDAVLSLKLQ